MQGFLSSQSRDQTHVSSVTCVGMFFTTSATWEVRLLGVPQKALKAFLEKSLHLSDIRCKCFINLFIFQWTLYLL